MNIINKKHLKLQTSSKWQQSVHILVTKKSRFFVSGTRILLRKLRKDPTHHVDCRFHISKLNRHLCWVDIDILSSRLAAGRQQGQGRAPDCDPCSLYYTQSTYLAINIYDVINMDNVPTTWPGVLQNAEVYRSLSMT